MELIENGSINFQLGQVKKLKGNDGILESIVCKNIDDENEIKCDVMLPFFGHLLIGNLFSFQLFLKMLQITLVNW